MSIQDREVDFLEALRFGSWFLLHIAVREVLLTQVSLKCFLRVPCGEREEAINRS